MISPTDEQLGYMKTSLQENVYLRACPGSGKTEVIAAKVAQAIGSWNCFPSGIAILTFSNSATNELKNRLFSNMGESVAYPHWISTFDSFLLSQVVASVASVFTGFSGKSGDHRIRIVDKSSSHYRTSGNISDFRVSACQYDYDLKSKRFIFDVGVPALNAKLNNIEQTQSIVDDLVKTKKRLWKAGFATFSDVEIFAIKNFANKGLSKYFENLARRYPVVFVDECQDLSLAQLRIIEEFHKLGIRFHFIGDLNQSIYSFRGSEPLFVKKFIEDGAFKSCDLTINWRSGQGIVDLCSSLLKLDRVSGNPTIQSIRPKLIQYVKCPSEIVMRVQELTEKYQHVVVVARGHSTLQRFKAGRELTVVEELALACIDFRSQDLIQVRQAMEKFAVWLTTKLRMQVGTAAMNCPHEVESKLVWRLFVSNCLKYLVAFGAADVELTWKNWASFTKKAIQSLPDQLFVPNELAGKLENLRKVQISAPAGLGECTLQSRLFDGYQDTRSHFRLATIHEVKGETHDATVLVSSLKPGKQQSHWKDWLADPTSEAARFAYVASSRPRHLLIWAVKKLKDNELKRLSSLGFEVI